MAQETDQNEVQKIAQKIAASILNDMDDTIQQCADDTKLNCQNPKFTCNNKFECEDGFNCKWNFECANDFTG